MVKVSIEVHDGTARFAVAVLARVARLFGYRAEYPLPLRQAERSLPEGDVTQRTIRIGSNGYAPPGPVYAGTGGTVSQEVPAEDPAIPRTKRKRRPKLKQPG